MLGKVLLRAFALWRLLTWLNNLHCHCILLIVYIPDLAMTNSSHIFMKIKQLRTQQNVNMFQESEYEKNNNKCMMQ